MMALPDDFRILLGGQEFRPAGCRMHAKTNGEQVEVIDWDTQCADCSKPMRIFTTSTFRDPRRRCDDCKAPGVKARSKVTP